MKKGLVFAGLGFELLGLVIAALFIGDLIDKQMGWQGYATAGMLILIMISWFTHLIVLVKKFMKEADDT